jgi:hypothetical protein
MKQRVCGNAALIIWQPLMLVASHVDELALVVLRQMLSATLQSREMRPHGSFAGCHGRGVGVGVGVGMCGRGAVVRKRSHQEAHDPVRGADGPIHGRRGESV